MSISNSTLYRHIKAFRNVKEAQTASIKARVLDWSKDGKKKDENGNIMPKEYLRKHQLYKSGSNAPPEILREIYKSAHLAGTPVINKSKDNLIHNFYKL